MRTLDPRTYQAAVSNLHGLLSNSAAAAPSHPAFIKGERTTRYEDLDRATRRFAAALHALGVRATDRVALVLDGDVDYLIAYYGVLRAGAVVVPLCSDTRDKPLRRALGDSGARAVILDAANTRYLPAAPAELPELHVVIVRGKAQPTAATAWETTDYAGLLEGTQERGGEDVAGDALASIVYTSGTTGEPKGVMLSHDNLLANSASIVQYLELTQRDVVGMVLPYYYSYGNSILHTHVRAGATIAQLTGLAFPARTVEELERHRCTGFSGVPASFARLLEAPSLATRELSSLRYFTQAGAAMPAALTQRLRSAFPRVRLFVMYGQTEASARLACLPPETLDQKAGSVGRAIPGVTLAIADADGRQLPFGQRGEVIARGANVMRGYWQRPEETALALRDGWLHTGDLGQLDEDGYLFLSGRQSEMIKSAAHRIGPCEIESVIEGVPGVRDCVVFGVPDELLGQAIAAFVVESAAGSVSKAALMRACMEQLPRFKVPQHVRTLDELPRSEAGKLQRGVLAQAFARGDGQALQ